MFNKILNKTRIGDKKISFRQDWGFLSSLRSKNPINVLKEKSIISLLIEDKQNGQSGINFSDLLEVVIMFCDKPEVKKLLKKAIDANNDVKVEKELKSTKSTKTTNTNTNTNK